MNYSLPLNGLQFSSKIAQWDFFFAHLSLEEAHFNKKLYLPPLFKFYMRKAAL